MDEELQKRGEVLLYDDGERKEFVSVVFQGENFWLTQSGMAELFDCTSENIVQHLKNIYTEGELSPEATTEKFSVVRKEGTREVRRTLDFYNLDAITAKNGTAKISGSLSVYLGSAVIAKFSKMSFPLFHNGVTVGLYHTQQIPQN